MHPTCVDSLPLADASAEVLQPGSVGHDGKPCAAADVRGIVASHRPFNLIMIATALLFVVISIGGLWLGRVTVLPRPLALRAVPPLLFLLGYFFYRWRRERRIQGLLLIVFWSFVFGLLYIAPMYIAARCPVGFQDEALARMDRAMGIHVPSILRSLEQFPRCQRFLDYCYDTLLFLVTVAIMVPPVCNQMGRAKEYLVAGIASAVIAVPIFALVPAQGPWVYYHYEAKPEQENVERAILALKNQDAVVLDYFQFEGIISFPSFHAVLAILAAFALWPIRLVRWPASLLAGLIVISTITTGWHYVVDVLAGILVAIASCLTARGYTHLETRLRTQLGPSPAELSPTHAS